MVQSMKVVASTKLTRAERAMKEAKKYGAANNGQLMFHTFVHPSLFYGYASKRNFKSSLHPSSGPAANLQSSSLRSRLPRRTLPLLPRFSTSPSLPTVVFAVVSTLVFRVPSRRLSPLPQELFPSSVTSPRLSFPELFRNRSGSPSTPLERMSRPLPRLPPLRTSWLRTLESGTRYVGRTCARSVADHISVIFPLCAPALSLISSFLLYTSHMLLHANLSPTGPNRFQPLPFRHLLRAPCYHRYLFRGSLRLCRLQPVRDGGGCFQGPCRVWSCQRHLHCSCRGTRRRDFCQANGHGERF